MGDGDPAPILELNKLELNNEDTAQMQAAYQAFLQAQQAVDAFRQHILETYLAARGSEGAVIRIGNPLAAVPAERVPFQNFRYTADYRFILPR